MDVQSKLFETALGIEKPLFISRIDFDGAAGELHICYKHIMIISSSDNKQ